jgi:hypothetical protein
MTGSSGGRFRRPGRPTRDLDGDPFAALGLAARADLSDDEVRAAWRRIAAATHPDRADGGDPERFAAAAAAYTELRTSFGRGEARAALGQAGTWPGTVLMRRGGAAARVPGWRPGWLALRVIATAMAATIAIVVSGHGPAGPALATGAGTWLLLTARRDIGSLVSTGRWHSARLRRPHKGPARGQPGSGPVATGRVGSEDHADQEPT